MSAALDRSPSCVIGYVTTEGIIDCHPTIADTLPNPLATAYKALVPPSYKLKLLIPLPPSSFWHHSTELSSLQQSYSYHHSASPNPNTCPL